MTSRYLIPVLANTNVSQDFQTLLVLSVLLMCSLLLCHLSFLIHDLGTASSYAVLPGVLFHSLIAALWCSHFLMCHFWWLLTANAKLSFKILKVSFLQFVLVSKFHIHIRQWVVLVIYKDEFWFLTLIFCSWKYLKDCSLHAVAGLMVISVV